MNMNEPLSGIEEIIEDAQNGRMFVLVDDEERENEGDLVIPAQMATPQAINFMAKYGRGLICLALTSQRVRDLGLPLMSSNNESRHQTAFTVSIEARDGIATGISAADRARSVQTAKDPNKGAKDIVSPGHVFPLEAQDGGVLVRAGHTEAAVDIARLSGLNASGVICEIMNEDGTMARMPDLVTFAQFHGLKIGTIADLISYRLNHDRFVERTIETTLDSIYGGEFKMIVYESKVANVEHVALIKGDLHADGPIMVRMHAMNILEDVFGDNSAKKAHDLHQAMRMIGEAECGVVVLIREPSPTAFSKRLKEKLGEVEVNKSQLRNYGVGAQILLDLGVRDMVLLSNTQRTIIGLEGYGLRITEQRAIPPIAV